MASANKQQKKLLLILTLSMLALWGTAAFILHYSERFKEVSQTLTRVELLSNQMIYLDDVLTMTARMNAYNPNATWVTRYHDSAQQLDDAIEEVLVISPYLHAFLSETAQLNQKLVKIEMQSMALVEQDNQAKAIALLFTPEYQSYKEDYSAQMQRAFSQINHSNQRLLTAHHENYQIAILAFSVQSTLFIFTWLYLLYFLRMNSRRLNELVTMDELTGLYNRRQFNVSLEQELHRCMREECTLMLAVIDVDYFKKYNDTYGHPKGDSVLATLGSVLNKHSRRATEFAFRIGGEEFALISSLNDKEAGMALMHKIVEDIARQAIHHQGNPPMNLVTVSIGITYLSAGEVLTEEEIYQQADKALYQAKGQGRNQIVEYQP